jgi:hypothetical protein
LIPKLLLSQALSRNVSDQKMEVGAIYRSTTQEKLASKAGKIDVILLSTWKTWRVSSKAAGRFKFERREAFTPQNQDEVRAWTEGKVEWERSVELNYYVLLPADIAKEAAALEAVKKGGFPSPDDALLPCAITFTRTSYPAGKVLATHIAKAAHFNMSPSTFHCTLGVELVKGDQNTYYVFTADGKVGKQSTPAEIAAAKKWHSILSKAKVRVDDTDEEPAAAAPDPAFDKAVAETF